MSRQGLLASSIKKYLTSLENFFDFILCDDIEVTGIEKCKIAPMVLKLSNWKKSFKKDIKERQWEKEMEDFELLVTPEQVLKYEESEHATKAKNLFSAYDCGLEEKLTQSSYCCMRDHLFIVVHFGCGHRSGVSSKATIEEFNTMKKIDGMYLLYVKKHKTAYKFGPATVSFNDTEYRWLRTYVQKLRPLTKPQSNSLFLSWSGKQMDSGQISNRINALWKKGGVFDNSPHKNICCNIIRKSISTGIREIGTGKYQEVAHLMTHSLKTSEIHYVIRQKQKSAAIGASVIRSHFRGTAEAPSSPRKQWTTDEISKLLHNFSKELARNQISLDEVISKFDDLGIVNVTPKQVYDKIQSLLRYSPMKCPPKQQTVVCNSFCSFYQYFIRLACRHWTNLYTVLSYQGYKINSILFCLEEFSRLS